MRKNVSVLTAVGTVGEAVKLKGRAVSVQRKAAKGGPAQVTEYANSLAVPGIQARPITAELVTLPGADGNRTAWRVSTEIALNADYTS